MGIENRSPLVPDQMESSLPLHFLILLTWHPKMEILESNHLNKNEPQST